MTDKTIAKALAELIGRRMLNYSKSSIRLRVYFKGDRIGDFLYEAKRHVLTSSSGKFEVVVSP